MKKLTKRFLSLIMALFLIAGSMSGISLNTHAEETGNIPINNDVNVVADEDDEPTAVLAFTSDIHNKDGNKGAKRLGTWITKMKELYGDNIDYMAFSGDMGYYQTSEDKYWTLTQADLDEFAKTNVRGIFTTGNHEYSTGNLTPELTDYYDLFTENQEAENEDDYRIYCMGSEVCSLYENGERLKNAYTYNQVTALSDYLDSVGNDKIIFIVTHFPLHYYKDPDKERAITYAGDIIDILNEASEDGKKIVFLWGHNHTVADKNETHYDEVFQPGDTLTFDASNEEKRIKFYYAAAGCMSDTEYSSGSHAVKGKGSIITIDKDKKLTITYYDESGNDVTEGGGSFKEKAPVEISSMTIVGTDGNPLPASPTLEVKKRLSLVCATDPVDATVRSIIWKSKDPSIATVDANGLVKGITPGSTTITASISDGVQEIIKSVDITITARTSSGVTYELTDSIDDEGQYLIVNTNEEGQAYALRNPGVTNDSISVANKDYKTEVEIIDNYIETDESDIIWTATEVEGQSGYDLTNEGVYLEGSDSLKDVVFANPQINSGRYWTYSSSSKTLRHRKSSSSSSTSYYLRYSSSNEYFVGTTSSSSSSNKIYLFKRTTPPEDPSGILLDTTTLNLSAGETASLKATVEPAGANKSLTWSSDNTAVATVNNGIVTAQGQGNATITVTTVNDKTATCYVTVTPAEMVTYVLTNKMEAGKKYLIATSKEGSTYLLSNQTGTEVANSLKGVQTTVSGEKITIAKPMTTTTLFEAYGTDDNEVLLRIGDQYLYADGSGALRMVAKSTISSTKFWHYREKDDNDTDINLLWFFNGEDNDYGYAATGSYKYYLKYDSSGNFTKGYVDNNNTLKGNTSIQKIYLYTLDEGSGETPATYTVTFHNNDHGTPPQPYTGITSGSKISEPEEPSAEGWIFEGWYKEATCENAWNFDSDEVTANTDLYAKWTKETPATTYTVTFHNNEHGTAPQPYTGLTSGSKISEPEEPSEAGWIFGGWYKEATCENAWNFDSDEVTANTDLYAKWTKETPATTYTVTFHNNEHGTAPQPYTGLTSGSKISEPEEPSEAGWIFGGWYKEATCENAWNFDSDEVTANTDLYAKWTKEGGQGEDPAVTDSYELTDQMVAGKKYLIATGKEGSVYLLSNQSGSSSLKGVQAAVEGGKIKITKEAAETTLFEAEGTNDNTVLLKIGDRYLYADGTTPLSMVEKSAISNNKYWHYKDKDNNDEDVNLLWFYRGTDGDYGYTGTNYPKFYLSYDASGNFTKANLGNSETFEDTTKTVQKIYLFTDLSEEPEQHEHVYGDPTWSWKEDYSEATATFTCSCGDKKTVTDSAPDVTVVSDATCTADKVVKYKAEVTFTFDNQKYYNETNNVPIANTAGHKWGEWEVTTPATTTSTGVETRICSVCHTEDTRKIDKLDPTPGTDPTPDPGNKTDSGNKTDPGTKTNPGTKVNPAADPTRMGIDGTPFGQGASLAAAEKAILNMSNDKDPAGSLFGKLTLRSPKQTKTSIKLSWTKVGNANTYIVYGNNCGTANKPKKLASVTGNSLTMKDISGQKLGKGKYYKFIVVAVDGSNMVVTTSKLIHVATKGGKVGNDKSVKVKKDVISKAKKLKVGKSLKLKAKAVAQSKKLKVKKHVAVRYESTDPSIATVTNKGKITAKKKGTCNVYAYAQNGVFKKIKVVVK